MAECSWLKLFFARLSSNSFIVGEQKTAIIRESLLPVDYSKCLVLLRILFCSLRNCISPEVKKFLIVKR